MKNYAILTNRGEYSIFQFNDQIIRFAISDKLEKYTRIVEWDKGYIVVKAKYKDLEEVEEYIDLVPILEMLYYDIDEFLKPIKEVKIDYTASCVIEAMHVHASDRKMTEAGSAKFFVMNNGDTTVEKKDS